MVCGRNLSVFSSLIRPGSQTHPRKSSLMVPMALMAATSGLTPRILSRKLVPFSMTWSAWSVYWGGTVFGSHLISEGTFLGFQLAWKSTCHLQLMKHTFRAMKTDNGPANVKIPVGLTEVTMASTCGFHGQYSEKAIDANPPDPRKHTVSPRKGFQIIARYFIVYSACPPLGSTLPSPISTISMTQITK